MLTQIFDFGLSLLRQKSFKALGCVFVLLIGVGIMDPFSVAYAERDVMEDIAKILSHLVDLIMVVSLIAIDVTGPLFGTELLTGPDVMQEGILPMWVIVRNMVNIGFVMMILYIALANLFTIGGALGGNNWTIKEKLPRLIGAMILINFSLWGFKVVLDAVYVGTVAVFSISDNVLGDQVTYKKIMFEQMVCDKDSLQTDEEYEHCKEIYKDDHELKVYEFVNKMLCGNQHKDADSSKCSFGYLSETYMTQALGREDDRVTNPGRNIMAAVGVHVMKIQALPSIIARAGTAKYDAFRLVDTVTFSAILGLIYALSFVAVLVAMLVRMVFLWIVMIASPLIVADMVMGTGWTNTFTEKITNTIIMPIKVAAAFTVSFLMVANLQHIATKDDIAIAFVTGDAVFKFGPSSIDLLWKVATIMAFWFALWAAFDKTVAQNIVGGVKTFGENIGKAAWTGVQNAPVLPFGKMDEDGNRQGLALNSVTKIDDMLLEGANKFEQEQTRKLRDRFGLLDSTANTFLKASTGLKVAVRKLPTITKVMDEFRSQKGSAEVLKDSQARSRFGEAFAGNTEITHATEIGNAITNLKVSSADTPSDIKRKLKAALVAASVPARDIDFVLNGLGAGSSAPSAKTVGDNEHVDSLFESDKANFVKRDDKTSNFTVTYSGNTHTDIQNDINGVKDKFRADPNMEQELFAHIERMLEQANVPNPEKYEISYNKTSKEYEIKEKPGS